MKINLKVRMKNKVFWLTIIPMALVLISQVARLFGFELELSGLSKQLVDIIETIFFILGVLGIVVDPTTSGVSDSERALEYTAPH